MSDNLIKHANIKPIKIFYSYSHHDEELRDKLANQLSSLRRDGKISDWHDRRIGAGAEWKEVINENLELAHLILLLISPDFIASNYIYDIEMKRAMERHDQGLTRVIPIILRPCDWNNTPFGKLQALPKDANPVTLWPNQDLAFLDVVEGIKQVID